MGLTIQVLPVNCYTTGLMSGLEAVFLPFKEKSVSINDDAVPIIVKI